MSCLRAFLLNDPRVQYTNHILVSNPVLVSENHEDNTLDKLRIGELSLPDKCHMPVTLPSRSHLFPIIPEQISAQPWWHLRWDSRTPP